MTDRLVLRTPAAWQERGTSRQEHSLPVREPASIEARRAEVALMARIRDGDTGAVTELYARFGGPLYSLAYQLTRDPSAAEEVVQDVFVAVWRDAARFDPAKGSPATWLFTLARHKAIDLLRRETTARSRSVVVDLTLERADEDVERDSWSRLRGERVRALLATLPSLQREAVELAFFVGLTHVEVAERLAIPLGTAKTRIRTGLLSLRNLLGDTLDEDPAR